MGVDAMPQGPDQGQIMETKEVPEISLEVRDFDVSNRTHFIF